MVLILLTGCKPKQEFTPKKNLDCSFSYSNNGIEYKGSIKSFDHSYLEIEMLSPALVNGLKYTKDKNGGRLSYLGLNVTTDNFEKGVFEAISDALSKISLNSLKPTKTKDGFFTKTDNLKLNFNNLGYLTQIAFNDIKIDFFDYK